MVVPRDFRQRRRRNSNIVYHWKCRTTAEVQLLRLIGNDGLKQNGNGETLVMIIPWYMRLCLRYLCIMIIRGKRVRGDHIVFEKCPLDSK